MELGLALFLILVALALWLFVYGLIVLKQFHRGTGLAASGIAVALFIFAAWLTAYTFGPLLFVLAIGLAVCLAAAALGVTRLNGSSRRRRAR